MVEIGDYIVDLYLLSALHILAGLIVLLIVLRIGLRDQDARAEIESRLGIIVLTVVIGWPYNAFCWVFSWPIWLMPVSQLFRKQR